jgi:ribosomal protein S18 acetylase RimI-like enzyme
VWFVRENPLPSILPHMPDTITIRPATPLDYAFIAQAIWAAECGLGQRSTYEALFVLTQPQTLDLLQHVLAEELDDCELSPGAFLVAEADGIRAATCAAWLEHPGLGNSTSLKAQALPFVLGLPRWRAAEQHLRALAQVAIPRTENTLQLESFFTAVNFRGLGLAAQLIAAQRARFPAVQRAEIQLAAHNLAAIAAYAKAGFVAVEERVSDDPLVAEILGGPGKLRLVSETL